MEAFTGKTAIVTGGASGIGFALAKAFLEDGANVMVADIERAVLDQSLSQPRNYGNRVRGVVCDVSQRSSIAAAKRETIGSFGRVHILCNNAGVASGGLIEEISDADWQWVIGVNFMGIVHGVSELVPHFKSHGERCHIVNCFDCWILSDAVCSSVFGNQICRRRAVRKSCARTRGDQYWRERALPQHGPHPHSRKSAQQPDRPCDVRAVESAARSDWRCSSSRN
jgi:hypothetical protein